MPRPTTKEQLLTAMQSEHTALEKILRPLTPEQMTHQSDVIHWAIKDILAHLFAWEQMCLGWYKVGLLGEVPILPAEGFNWRQIPALNKQIYENYHDQPLEEIMKQFQASYQQMLETVKGISEVDLFKSGRYAWTKENIMATYFISATSSHYNWAKKEIKKCLK